jgi:hypothetical protein
VSNVDSQVDVDQDARIGGASKRDRARSGESDFRPGLAILNTNMRVHRQTAG